MNATPREGSGTFALMVAAANTHLFISVLLIVLIAASTVDGMDSDPALAAARFAPQDHVGHAALAEAAPQSAPLKLRVGGYGDSVRLVAVSTTDVTQVNPQHAEGDSHANQHP
jgi:hypothetical protein